MSPRLAELLRQRRLLEEHLTWLDAEIAQEKGSTPSKGTAPAAPTTLPAGESIPGPSAPGTPKGTEIEAEAEEILRQFVPETRSASEEARRGCFIAFGLLMLAVAAVVVGTYFIYGDRSAPALQPTVEKPR